MVVRSRDEYRVYCLSAGHRFQYHQKPGETASAAPASRFPSRKCREPYRSQKTGREPRRVVTVDRTVFARWTHCLATAKQERSYHLQLAQQTRPGMATLTSAAEKNTAKNESASACDISFNRGDPGQE